MGLYTTVANVHEKAYTVQEAHDIDAGSSMSVTLECDWADRHSVITDVIGNGYSWPHGTFPNSIARKATITAAPNQQYTLHGSGGAIVYNKALVTIHYLVPPDGGAEETTGGDLYSETLEPIVEFLKQNPDRFAWASGTGPPVSKEEAPGKQMYMCNIVRTWFDLISIPSQVFTCIGKVNNAAYASTSLGQTFAAETLLYQPPTLSRTVKVDGSKNWTLTLKFAYKPDGWNKFWRAGINPAAWGEFYDLAAGAIYKNYPLIDMSALLFS